MIVSVVVVPVLLAEFSEVAPWLARKALRGGARFIGDAALAERYAEEWVAALEDTPGKVTKLVKAMGVVVGAVPALHWNTRGYAYRWQIVRLVDATLSIVAPSLARRWRLKRRMTFTFHPVGSEGQEFSINLGDLMRALEEAEGIRGILPRSVAVREGVTVDFQRKRIYLGVYERN